MPSTVVTVRYPNGETEYRSTPEELKTGDTLTCRGATWLVAKVEQAAGSSTQMIVTLRPTNDGGIAA